MSSLHLQAEPIYQVFQRAAFHLREHDVCDKVSINYRIKDAYRGNPAELSIKKGKVKRCAVCYKRFVTNKIKKIREHFMKGGFIGYHAVGYSCNPARCGRNGALWINKHIKGSVLNYTFFNNYGGKGSNPIPSKGLQACCFCIKNHIRSLAQLLFPIRIC